MAELCLELISVDTDIEKRIEILTQLKEKVEASHPSENKTQYQVLIPALIQLLQEVPPSFVSDNNNKARLLTLEVLNRLPNTEALKDHVKDILALCAKVMEIDNEQNALISLRITFDLHKNFRALLENEVSTFINFAQMIYGRLDIIVRETFGENSDPIDEIKMLEIHKAQQMAHDNQTLITSKTEELRFAIEANIDAQTIVKELQLAQVMQSIYDEKIISLEQKALIDHELPKLKKNVTKEKDSTSGNSDGTLVQSISSFLVLKECPPIISLLFQLHQKCIPLYIPTLISLMIPSLNIVAPRLTEKSQQYLDFIACQVKTLQLITFLLRHYSNLMTEYADVISSTLSSDIVRLLRATPPDAIVTRKELLVATRHILATEMKSIFFPLIDILLDEQVIIGNGLVAYESFLPIAYSTLADLVHHVRTKLNIDQISRAMSIFARNVHDPSLSVQLHSTCVRLLLNFVDPIYHHSDLDKLKGRKLLVRILTTLIEKLGTLRVYIHDVMEFEESRKKVEEVAYKGDTISDIGNIWKTPELVFSYLNPKNNARDDLESSSSLLSPHSTVLGSTSSETKSPALPIPETMIPFDARKMNVGGRADILDSVKEVRALTKTIIIGLKTVIWCLSNYNDGKSIIPNAKIPLNEYEIGLIVKLLQWGLKCFPIFKSVPEEEKETLDHFASLFNVLEPYNFRDVFNANIELLVDAILEDKVKASLPQSFLHRVSSNPSSSGGLSITRCFAEVLLNYLVRNIKKLAPSKNASALDLKRAEWFLKLFKIVFGSVTAYGNENEPALRPHLQNIILYCMEQGTLEESSIPFFQLLRHLFRSIAGGKFELLYKAFLPLLPGTLEQLLHLHQNTSSIRMKHLLLELCMTVPARLSSLIPHLSVLRIAVISAIQSYENESLCNLGMRTLEFWINNLDPMYLHPLLSSEPILTNLIESLNNFLLVKPISSFGSLAMKLLGKLGGKNRDFLLSQKSKLLFRENILSPGLQIQFNWEANTSFPCFNTDSDDKGFSLNIDDYVGYACKFIDRHYSAISMQQRFASSVPTPTSEAQAPINNAKLVNFKKQALNLLKSSFAASLKVLSNGNVMGFSVNYKTTPTVFTPCEIISDDVPSDIERLSQSATEVTFNQILSGLLISCSDSDLKASATEFMKDVCRHVLFVIIKSGGVQNDNVVSLEGNEMDIDENSSNAESSNSGRNMNSKYFLKSSPPVVEGTANLNVGKNQINPLILCDVITDGFSDERPSVVESASQFLSILMQSIRILYPNHDEIIPLCSIIHSRITEKLCHGCFESSNGSKRGGLRGLNAILDVMPRKWVIQNEIQIFHAVIHAVKHKSENLSIFMDDLGKNILFKLISISFTSNTTFDNDALSRLDRLLSYFPTQIVSAENIAREIIQNMILLIIKTIPKSHATESIISKLSKSIYESVLSKPLKESSPVKQVAILDTILFCLSSTPPLFQTDNNIMKKVTEAVVITEVEDPNTLPSIALSKLGEYGWKFQKMSESKSGDGVVPAPKIVIVAPENLIAFRCLTIKLIKCVIFTNLATEDIRNRFVSIPFNSLLLTGERGSTLVDTATDAINFIVQNSSMQPITDKIFQECLRPIMIDLTDYRKLTLQLLSNVSIILKLLSRYFTSSIGNKLLEHLRRWNEPEIIMSLNIWKSGEELLVCSSILNLFHLLPESTAFLPEIVHLVLMIESKMCEYKSGGYVSSPLIIPLANYLDRYSSETIEFFLSEDNLVDRSCCSLFMRVLELPEASVLLAKVFDSGNEIIACSFAKLYPLITAPEATNAFISQKMAHNKIADIHLSGIRIVHALSNLDLTWIGSQVNLLNHLLRRWRSNERQQRLLNEGQLDLDHQNESKWLVEIFMSYSKCQPQDVFILFELLPSFETRSLIDYSFLLNFYRVYIPQNYSNQNISNILKYFIENCFVNSTISMDLKVIAFDVLIIPVMATALSKETILENRLSLLPENFIHNVMSKLLIVKENGSEYPIAMNIQLLKLETLMIQYLGDQFMGFRRELIKFAWNHLKSDDLLTKMYAYLTVARFIATFDAPSKIILQVYVALLRQTASESRALAQQALDILVPALPFRLPKSDFIKAMTYTKKMLEDECYALPQIIHLMQLIVRHPVLFYKFRSFFIMPIAPVLSKLGLPHSGPSQNRQLSIDLCHLIIAWEQRRRMLVTDKSLLKLSDNNFAVKLNLKNKVNASLLGKRKLKKKASLSSLSSINKVSGVKRKNPFSGNSVSSTPPAKRIKTDEGISNTTNGGALNTNFTVNIAAMPSDDAQESSAANDAVMLANELYEPSTNSVETIISFLIKACLVTSGTNGEKEASRCTRSLALLSTVIKMWPKVNVKFSNFERLLPEVEKTQSLVFKLKTKDNSIYRSGELSELPTRIKKIEENIRQNNNVCWTCCKILSNILSSTNGNFFTINQINIEKYLALCFDIEDKNIQEGLAELLACIFMHYPESRGGESLEAFYSKVNLLYESKLNAASSYYVSNNIPEGENDDNSISGDKVLHYNIIFPLLEVAMKNRSRYARKYIPSLFTIYESIIKGFIVESRKRNISVQILTYSTNLLYGSLSYLDESHRFKFVSLLGSLLQSNQNIEIISTLLSFLEQSILFNQNDSKEASSLVKNSHFFIHEIVSMILCMTKNVSELVNDKKKRIYHHFFSFITPIINTKLRSLKCWCDLEVVIYRGLFNADAEQRRDILYELFKNQKSVHDRLETICKLNLEPIGKNDLLAIATSILLQSLQTINDSYVVSVKDNCSLIFDLNEVVHLNSISTETKNLIHQEGIFLNKLKSFTSKGLLNSLCDLSFGDRDFSGSLWVRLFVGSWSSLNAQERDGLTSSLVFLLSSPSLKMQSIPRLPSLTERATASGEASMRALSTHVAYRGITNNIPLKIFSKFSSPAHFFRRNSVHYFLDGIQLAKPQPYLPSEIVSYIAKTYSNWQACGILLEQNLLTLPYNDSTLNSLASIYTSLSEDDYKHGCYHYFSSNRDSQAALALEAHGLYKEAQEMYINVLSKVNGGIIDATNVPAWELDTWEASYVNCSKQLSQWDTLYDYAYTTSNISLLLESSSKLNDWNLCKDLLRGTKTMQAARENPTVKNLINQICLSIQEGNIQEVENLYEQVVETALNEWRSLPSYISPTHTNLLVDFQRIIELQESAQIMEKICSKQGGAISLKEFFTVWRDRLPNKWDKVSVWDDVMTWRNSMFSFISQAFSHNENGLMDIESYQDSGWTSNILSKICRKNGLRDTAVNHLNRLYGFDTIPMRDQFEKVREQVLILYKSPEHIGGLNLINSMDMELFSVDQKREIFRLKGDFLAHLGKHVESSAAYSHALHLSNDYSKAWLSWGEFLDNVFMEKKDINFAAQSMCCYLQAIRFEKNSDKDSGCHLMINRILWMVSNDDLKGTMLCTFKKYFETLPTWVWLPWIPQLLTALTRAEAPHMRTVLLNIAKYYPQAIYYALRTFLLEKREMPPLETPNEASEAGGNLNLSVGNDKSGTFVANKYEIPPNTPAPVASANTQVYVRTVEGTILQLQHGTTLYQLQNHPSTKAKFAGASHVTLTPALPSTPDAKNQHPPVDKTPASNNATLTPTASASPPQQILVPIKSSLAYAEELMNFINNTHHSISQSIESILEELMSFKNSPIEELLVAINALLVRCYQLPKNGENEPVPANLTTTLERVCSKFFSEPENSYIMKFKASFLNDFKINKLVSLDHIIQNLGKWKNGLEVRINALHKVEKLENHSRFLGEFRSSEIEIPGQYVENFTDPNVCNNAILEKFDTNFKVVNQCPTLNQRRVTMIGNDGRMYYFLIQYAAPNVSRSDERMCQLHSMFNKLFELHNNSKRRQMKLQVQVMVPINPRMKLTRDDPNSKSFGDIYNEYCLIKNMDPDLPIITFRNTPIPPHVLGATAEETKKTSELRRHARHAAYGEICKTLVSDTILSNHFQLVFSDSASLWQFKREFTIHWALSSFLSYLLCIGDRTPSKIIISLDSGGIKNIDSRPSYNQGGLLDQSESVPFRFTRNLSKFISPFGRDGLFANSMIAAGESLLEERQQTIFRNYLRLFLRDDLLSWHLRIKPTPRNEIEERKMEMSLREKVHNNVKKVFEKACVIAPHISNPGIIKKVSVNGQAQPINEGVLSLINLASDDRYISHVSSIWHPWL